MEYFLFENEIMSARTIIVGILAAFCGICATVGVMMLNQGTTGAVATPKTSVLIAKVDLDMGQQILDNQLASIEWNSDTLPPGALSNPEDAVEMYCIAPIAAGEVISTNRIGENPTTLLPAAGLRAYAIDATSASTNVGRNLVPGNRVDIIWQTKGKLQDKMDPISVRLLQNVKILAVGQVQGELESAQKSITLEVKPTMDENLAFAQSYGELSLSLRNPGDNEGVDPVETTKFKDLLADLENKAREPEQAPVWEALVAQLTNRIASLEDKLTAPAPTESDRETLSRIGRGMRAITIQTPNESTGLAGLLEPGDRVDLQFTLTGKPNAGPSPVARLIPSGDNAPVQVPSETLIENIEVLAVDSNIFSVSGDDRKEMSRSVTLIVLDEMIQDIARASQLGTLTLTLRGISDAEAGPPRMVLSVDQFVARHMPMTADPVTDLVVSLPTKKIRTIRGPAVQELQFTAADDDGSY